jgi:MFS family permease
MTSSEKPEKKGRVYIVSAISALRGATFNAWRVIWQPFVLSLGVSMSRLGGLESLLDLTRIVVMPFFGKASDVYGRRRFIVAREVFVLAAAVLYIYAESWRFLFLGVIFTGLSMAVYPVWNTVIAESSEGRELGYTYSIVGTITLALSLVATLTAGYVASTYGFKTVFTGSAVLVLLSFLVVVMRLPETLSSSTTGALNLKELAGSFMEAFRPPRHLWGWYIAMTVDSFAFHLGFRLINGMLARGYGYTPAMLGLMSAVVLGLWILSYKQ